jgi:Type II secretion system (T2SS), protein M
VTDRLFSWWGERARREQALLVVAAVMLIAMAGLRVSRAVQEDLGALRRRVAVAEHDLRAVRRLAGRVGQVRADTTPATALMPYLETVADSTVGRDHIAAMTPVMATGAQGEQVSVRIVEASLEDTVRMLHALESGSPQVRPTALHLVEHPHDPGVFDAVVEVERQEALP